MNWKLTIAARVACAVGMLWTVCPLAEAAKTKKPSKGPPPVKMRLDEFRQLSALRESALATKRKADFSRAKNAAIETTAAQKAADAKSAIEQLQANMRANSDERKEIERRLEAEAGATSPIGQAGHLLAERRQTLNQIRKRLKSDGVAQQRDPGYAKALFEYQTARAVHDRLKRELISADETWRSNVAAARELQQQLKEALDTADIYSAQKSRASSQRRTAEKDAAAANAALEHTEKRGLKPVSSIPKTGY